MDKVRSRIVHNHDDLYVKLTLTSGWTIESVSNHIFYEEGDSPLEVKFVINNLCLPLEDVDTLQIDVLMFKKAYDPNVLGKYKWLVIK